MEKGLLYLIIFWGCYSCSNDKEITNKEEVKSTSKQLETKSSSKVASSVPQFLQDQQIETFPFSFGEFILSSLEERSKYDELLNATINQSFNSDDFIKELKLKTILSDINKDTKPLLPKHYHFLLEYGGNCSFSSTALFKRLPPIKDIEVFLTITKILQAESKNPCGIILDLITYDTDKASIISKQRIITAGIGLEDITYREGFLIDSNYEIKVKGYVSMEDGKSIIERTVKVSKDGVVKVLNNKVIANE